MVEEYAYSPPIPLCVLDEKQTRKFSRNCGRGSNRCFIELLDVIVRVDALNNSTQKLVMEKGSQFTYTLQHLHSRAATEKRHKHGNK
jgi:predicted ribonuclease YlaK